MTMAIDQKAFFAESKRIEELLGCSREQADMIAAAKFWDGAVDEQMRPTEGEPVSRRPSARG
jgi:hypothetical protein